MNKRKPLNESVSRSGYASRISSLSLPLTVAPARLGLRLLLAGFLVSSVAPAFAAVHFVSASSVAPSPPYASWETAARAIQDAVDVAEGGDEVVVTNGTYATGGRAIFGAMTNRVAITNSLKVRSVNGPLFTIIQGFQVPGTLMGDGAIRCVYLANGASLSGFTLTNGATRITGDQMQEGSGGGIMCQGNASVSNCVIAGNIVPWWGGGAYGGTLNNCLLVGNSATNWGGGACSNQLNNCTIAGNAAMYGSGGVVGATLRNCIVYFNRGYLSSNYASSFFAYSCTTPAPASGSGNIGADPLFRNLAGYNLRLSSNSPCINAGNNASAPSGPDLDGNPRVFDGTIDMGAYEFQGAPVAGTHYVDVNCANPTAPYNTWATAARTIQDAVDAAVGGDEIVVTNGTYTTGGRAVFGAMTNRVAITIPLTVRSVNGPLHTIIQGQQAVGSWSLFGDGAIRCVYLANGASLTGFTLTNGATRGAGDYVFEGSGGGVWCQENASVSNCIITGSAAYWMGGGAYGGRLNNCLLYGNSVTNTGGGACSNILNNCTIAGNTCLLGAGGAANATLRNSIIYLNQGRSGQANYSGTIVDYCCTSPLPAGGSGNIGADPMFVDFAGRNLRLGGNSPCINAGNNSYAPTGGDLDENLRIFAETVDMGAYEYQGSPSPVAPYITVQPTNQTVEVGSFAAFAVSAGGTAPLNYQWRFYGTNLSGATKEMLVLPNVQPTNAGIYFAVVTNSYGAVTSSVAELSVTNIGPPTNLHTHYVALNSPNPTAPFTSWATAARLIQDAVDAAVSGDEIVVTNGIYAEGGRAIHGFMTNRVTVNKPLSLRSVNGSQFTLIQGRQVPGTTNGDGAIRCVYLANGSSLTGFTLTNGATRSSGDVLTEQSGGGLWCGNTGVVSAAVSVKDCVLAGNSAAQQGGGAYQGTFGFCTFAGNSAPNGGGAAWATMTNSTVAGNTAVYGGGVIQSWLGLCDLLTNRASLSGGGVSDGRLILCTVSGNSAPDGGGAHSSALTNCFLTGNLGTGGANTGGGASLSTLNNCLVLSNSATLGGGSYGGTLINCTVAANTASVAGGGVWNSVLMNTIAYFNTAADGNNYYLGGGNPNGSMNYCCTTPQPPSGVGNLSSDPQFRDLPNGYLQLQVNSPCVNAGLNSYVGVYSDLNWNPRIVNGTVDIGAYEETNVVVALPYITQQPASQSATAGSDVVFYVVAGGTPELSYQWNHNGQSVFGATGSTLTLANVQAGDAGKYTVTVGNAAGQVTSTEATLTVNPPAAHYVDVNSPNPTPPYSSWSTAARTIQEAVDAASALEEVVVTNGVYATGGLAVDGTMTNRVALTKRVTLRSVNGPEFTAIEGYQIPGTTNGDEAIRCVYLTNGAGLFGFTLTNGATRNSGNFLTEQCGGGVFVASYYYYYTDPQTFVSNCVVVGNSAAQLGGGAYGGQFQNCTLQGNSANSGGGAAWATLNNCKLTGNIAFYGGGSTYGTLNNCVLTGNSAYQGGGCNNGTLNNCTIVGNSAQSGGGAAGMATNSFLYNCIVYYNYAPEGSNYFLFPSGWWYSAMYNCCTAPEQSSAIPTGNFTNEPVFVDLLGGDLQLQSTSPCINAGNNSYAPGTIDLDGNPRISGSSVDVGAYEFQGTPVRTTHYVSAASTTPVAPYTSWETAATAIQDAIEVAAPGAEILVTNGLYATGGRPVGVYDTTTTRVAILKSLTVRSVNGPQYTVIAGSGDLASPGVPRLRGVYLANHATLSGFTVTNGFVDGSYVGGGGVYCNTSDCVVSNCVILNNVSFYSGGGVYGGQVQNSILKGNLVTNSYSSGGGASSSILSSCVIIGNTASGTTQASGAGASGCTLYNCTLVGNETIAPTKEAAASYCRLTNCIVYFNTTGGGLNHANSTLAYCCSIPLVSGPGNISAEPQFVDLGGGNLHLSPGSPCADAGYSAAVQIATDLDGTPRLQGGAVDLGAYEFPGSLVAVHYVNAQSANPMPPYTSWATAAVTIQDAIDAAAPGDEVLVTNGAYATGGRVPVSFSQLVCRVAITKPLAVRSVNGPQYTVIQGYQLPGLVNGEGAIRCAYLTNGATLSGFTLAGGGTRTTGDNGREQCGGGAYCESTNAVVSNCVLTKNSAGFGGGGMFAGTLNNCVVSSNWLAISELGGYGGGALGGVLNNCLAVGNSAGRDGGAVSSATLRNCTVMGNTGGWGGGVANCRVTNSIVYFNAATVYGENWYFNGTTSDQISFCDTTPLPSYGIGNISADPLFVNRASGDLHLRPDSPCRNIGNNGETPSGPDLDGNPRIASGFVDMGAYELQEAGGEIAPYIVLQPTSQTARAGSDVTFTFTGGGTLPLTYQWSFQGADLGNRTDAALVLHNVALGDAGNYAVTVRNASGSTTSSNATLTVTLMRYADVANPNPAPPYTNWDTAATRLQDVVDVAISGDEIVVADGVYATGGRAVYGTMTNRVAITKPLTVRSVNGPEVTIIQGYQVPGTTNGDSAVRCMYMTNGTAISGFTIRGGATQTSGSTIAESTAGGGIYCDSPYDPANYNEISTSVISNCVLTGNSAYFFGGGAYRGILVNCTLTHNSVNAGGGAWESVLNGCLVVSNSAPSMGGGVLGGIANNCTIVGNKGTGAFGYWWGKSGQHCTLNNCIVYYNEPEDLNSWSSWYSGSNCCVAEIKNESSWSFVGAITNAPLFVDLPAGDLRLQPGSPCINAGNNNFVLIGTDLAGNSRIVGGTVDMGAYEFQGTDPTPFTVWLERYGLPTDGSADYIDSDDDGLNNWQEWCAGTNPTNVLSTLRLLSAVLEGVNVSVSWESVAGINYSLERSAIMWPSSTNQPSAFAPIVTNLPGQVGITTFIDSNVVSSPGLFYRVGVRTP
jgi:hypothetical protein